MRADPPYRCLEAEHGGLTRIRLVCPKWAGAAATKLRGVISGAGPADACL